MIRTKKTSNTNNHVVKVYAEDFDDSLDSAPLQRPQTPEILTGYSGPGDPYVLCAVYPNQAVLFRT